MSGIAHEQRRVLSVSTDTECRTCDDMLAAYGFTVLSPRHPMDAPQLVAEQNVEVAVVGQSVDAEERRQVISAIREVSPECPVVFVYVRPLRADEPLANEQIDITDGFLVLIDALERLTAA